MSDWKRYAKYLCHCPEAGLMLDISGMGFDAGFLDRMEPAMQRVYKAMAALESGVIANPDENRMVGHYWLRNSALAPDPKIAAEIEFAIRGVKDFAASVHSGEVAPPGKRGFTRVLIVGIGGSALGPQFVADALGTASGRLKIFFFDNTDPDGMDKVLAEIGPALPETMVVVISKSGGTKETRNGMVEARAAYIAAGLDFPGYAVAVTGAGSELDKEAVAGGWLARFPMWDWVGGRTSVTSAVGLLPAALQGVDIDALIDGARICDQLTRSTETCRNPAALLALMWYYGSNGRGEKDMVVLPYKDRLLLFSRYLQQLIMESIGKELDLDGNLVNQGLAVYGNKGSTDQHAYVQQLREGTHNFFVTFIEVLKDRKSKSMEVEPGVTSGDFLAGFLQGTRKALAGNGRDSMTITVEKLDAATVGTLIALYERAVGFYATLVNINAYHQPGVEAGKKAATAVLKVQEEITGWMKAHRDEFLSADKIAAACGHPDETETVFRILLHLASNPDRGIMMQMDADICCSRFRAA